MKKRVLVIAIAVIAVASAAVAYRSAQRVAEPDAILLSGNIEVTDAEVSFKIAGRVAERLVSEGQPVAAGQIVARLDADELVREVGVREADVLSAQADLAELLAGFRPEEIAQAEAALARARAEAERWRAESARQAELYAQDIVSAREDEAARTSREVAVARVKEAEEHLALLRKGPRAEQIAQARARVGRAREARALAETRLGYAVLRAPMSGVVIADHIEAGEYVAPGTPVATIAAMDTVWLRAYLDETDLGRVKLGQRAQVTTDTFPDKEYSGTVSFIAPDAEFTPKNVQTEKERVKLVYRIKVDIPNLDGELKPGMPADARIDVGTPAAAASGAGPLDQRREGPRG